MKVNDAERLEQYAVEFCQVQDCKAEFIKAAVKKGDSPVSFLYSFMTGIKHRYTGAMAANEKIQTVECYRSGRLAALIKYLALDLRRAGAVIEVGATKNERLVSAIKYYNSAEVALQLASIVPCPAQNFNELERRAAAYYDKVGASKLEGYDLACMKDKTITFRRPRPLGNPGHFGACVGPGPGTLLPKDQYCFTSPTNSFFKTTGNNIMSIFERFTNKAIAKPTIIFGQLTDDMDDNDYETSIRRINGEIESYADIKNSKKIDKKVEALRAELIELTELYDATDD